MGNYNCTTGSGSTTYSRLRSSHTSHDDDHSLRDPLLRNIRQRVEDQQQQLLHHIYGATRVKETVKSAITSSSSSSNPNPISPPSKSMEQKPSGHHGLGKELHQDLIRLGVAKPKALASCSSCYKQGEAIKNLKEKNATLEKRVLELTASMEDQMKRIRIPAAGSGSGSEPQILINSNPIPDLINLRTPVPDGINEIIEGVLGAEIEMKNNSMMSEQSSVTPALQSDQIIYGALNDLTGCLVVLIFLLAVLIGVLL
ncbi:hypothetical protein DKX38_023314 [Salix brachista]|uniref:Uncharacterized protein n=1 Tax=Salix brachista TaxID=2182728 RepID=A0A5N5JPG1_9ROSI|nr:hypothetical protein DKX38_023314 [Salix brachista]